MSLTRASTVVRGEERRVLIEHLQDRDRSGLTQQECALLTDIFRAAPLPNTYEEVWHDQRKRDEGRLLMAQARLRATMAKQPPPVAIPDTQLVPYIEFDEPDTQFAIPDTQSSQGSDIMFKAVVVVIAVMAVVLRIGLAF